MKKYALNDSTATWSRGFCPGRFFAVLVILLMVSGCMGLRPGGGDEAPPAETGTETAPMDAAAPAPPEKAPSAALKKKAPAKPRKQAIRSGAEKEPRLKHIVKPKKKGGARRSLFGALGKSGASKSRGKKTRVELAFDNADLYEVLDVALFELFGISYMVDPSIKARVTFHLSGEYTRDEFVGIVNDVLQLNNLAITGGPGNIFKVVRRNAAAGTGNRGLVKEGGKNPPGNIIRRIRLRYLAAATAYKNIKPFLSKGATIVKDDVTNALVIGDTSANIEKAAGILGSMDQPYFKEISWQIFPLADVTADEVSKDIKSILKSGGPLKPVGIVKGSFELYPIKTMNALLVVTKWPEMLGMVEDWVKVLDRPSGLSSNVHVYFVENGSAVELVDILKQLYGAKSSDKKKVAVVKPTAKDKKAVAKKSTASKVTGELSGDVEIIPDEANNAIVFKASDNDYRLIKTVLSELDIVPRQVLIKVMIAEVQLTNEIKYGVQWLLNGSHGGSTFQVARGADITNQTLSGFAGKSGLIGALTRGETISGIISALESDTDVKILSSPNILALDNKEATIEVTDETPTETGKVTSSEGTTTSTTIEFKKTGIILKVTPHINSNGLVKMELDQEVSSLGTKDEDSGRQAFLTRKAVTSLVVEDGQTIIMGGLMRTDTNNNEGGIPLLKDIPYLGKLFSSTDDKTTNTELLFFITPRVIQNRGEADIITREFSETLKEVMGLIENQRILTGSGIVKGAN